MDLLTHLLATRAFIGRDRTTLLASIVPDLAQGMRAVGFQGVLIVRPHGDAEQRRRGRFQLVYGHRRRVVWHRVCTERGERCALLVIVREIGDAQMLMIGAQENLQRQDLDPVEQAQIVAWHERVFFDKNQAEIGTLLGKSSDWVSVRSRIHRLPDALKERLRQRPRAISQMLELGVFCTQQPDDAIALADRVVSEHLTLEAIRSLVRGYARPEQRRASDRDILHKRRGATTPVQDVTSEPHTFMAPAAGEEIPLAIKAAPEEVLGMPGVSPLLAAPAQRPLDQLGKRVRPFRTPHSMVDRLVDLEGAAAALTDLAEHADDVPGQSAATRAILQAEQALLALRRALLERAISGTLRSRQRVYRLIDADLCGLLVLLSGQRAIGVRLCAWEGRSTNLQLMLCRLPVDGSGDPQSEGRVDQLFVAVLGGGQGLLHLQEGVSLDQLRNMLRLTRSQAATLGTFIDDLVRAYVETIHSQNVP